MKITFLSNCQNVFLLKMKSLWNYFRFNSQYFLGFNAIVLLIEAM